MAYRISRVTTRSGDNGTTGIAGGVRLPKDDPRIEALGTVDELNCQLGLLLALAAGMEACRWVEEVQQDLFDLGAIIAQGKLEWKGEEKSAQLERWIEKLNAALPPLEEFVLPGGGVEAAQCHVARAVCRRAERRVVALDDMPETARVYLNRLSDLLFVLARTLAREKGEPERFWQGASRPGED
ncbi:MAG: cob(I)yrinic acid a,c-diamide adenosyltransferase [Gammaproteobacteria bacterium]|nr:cob(I)yrinic acid a,c-diamide adenosyltransferase [Gammaproteobacteria bacterium]